MQLQEGTISNGIELTGSLKDQVTKSGNLLESSMEYIDNRTEMFKSILENDTIPEEVKEDAKKYLEETQIIADSMSDTAEQFQEIMDQQNKLLNEMQNEYRREDIIGYAQAIRDRAYEENNIEEMEKSDHLIYELTSSVSLDVIFKGVYEVKNLSKIISIANDDKEFYKIWKKYVDRLKNNSSYIFRDPSHLLVDLINVFGTETDTKIFLTSYCKFFSMKSRVENFSVFINEFSRNIENIENEKFLERNILIDNLKEYVQYIKEQ